MGLHHQQRVVICSSTSQELVRTILAAILELLIDRVCLLRACLARYSVVYRGECSQGKVAVKVYEKPSMAPKKQKMATREAIVLKYLNSQG